ncbi:MAG: hypothetical protein M3R36_18445 [Bacteroidota bacterium]|nr:hypothetical protein [Bacteroidota bacterium]
MPKIIRIKRLILITFAVFICSCSLAAGFRNIEPAVQAPDSNKKTSAGNVQKDTTANTPSNLPIDTSSIITPEQTVVPIDTAKKTDTTLLEPVSENTLTNTKLSIYILLSVIGLGLFFFIFVINLFKTFHKKKSTRQSLLLSWNLFFIVTIIWIFIIWGLVAGFWTSASFMIVVIFLFIISLIMTIIAIKSK